ncbi:MAG: glycosyltransferase [Lachnospiraceae bacterium]|nr:glycosyltransferase [Lachnospiraceae bacterium]
MNILFYTWDEFTFQDGFDALERLGHKVTKLYYEWKNITEDAAFEGTLLTELQKTENNRPAYDLVFSFNFFPVVSAACQKTNTAYISLVFDSPFLPLTSIHIDNPCNRIYTFDRRQAEQMRAAGHTTMHYSPLGVDAERIREQTEALYAQPYEHEICFLGSLYNNEDNYYDEMEQLPPHLKGYFDGVIAAQEHVFGHDLIGDGDVVPEELIEEMHRHVRFERTDQYTMNENGVLRDVLRRKVTQSERPKLLGRLAKIAPVDLYTDPKQAVPEGVTNLGYASYRRDMPHIFNRSKINLNITMRTIISGIPLRVTDVLAAGGFLITTYQEEIAAQFRDGEELVIAYTPEDLAEKCAYYLAHEEEREAIAAAGRAKVLAAYDYADIFEKMIKESV